MLRSLITRNKYLYISAGLLGLGTWVLNVLGPAHPLPSGIHYLAHSSTLQDIHFISLVGTWPYTRPIWQ